MKKLVLAAIAMLGLLAFSGTTALGCGTGTPGYWVNHPEAWPVNQIEIGSLTYTKAEAIALMAAPVKGDKWLTMFPALVAAMLNVANGSYDSCIKETITCAKYWVETNANRPVTGKSDAWCLGEPLYCELDAYNNGLLCEVSRDSEE